MMVAAKDLKNNNKVIADKTSEPIKNQSISFLILSAMMVLINGNPLICTSVFVALLKSSKAVCRPAIIFVLEPLLIESAIKEQISKIPEVKVDIAKDFLKQTP
jgi:hypothetical protein